MEIKMKSTCNKLDEECKREVEEIRVKYDREKREMEKRLRRLEEDGEREDRKMKK